MTEEEKKEIVDAVIARINANTQAVEDLPTSDNLSDFTTLPVLGSDGSMKKLRADRLKGAKGDALTFDQLTEDQKAQLKGPKGDKMTFADLTSEEKAQLKGPKGDKMTFADLTSEEKAQLKGPKGDKMTFADLTSEEKESLKGASGDSGIPTVVDHWTGDRTFALTPNVYHRWGAVDTLNLSIGTASPDSRLSEYMAEFTCPSGSPTTLTMPDTIRWAGGSAPTIQAGLTYQMSIVNNIAIIIGG